MSRWLRCAYWLGALLPIVAGISGPALAADDVASLARDAYIFTFPLYESYRIRYLAECASENPRRSVPNAFRHRRELTDYTSRLVTTPNSDTLFSNAFLDLSAGPLVLQVPEITDRYYSLAFMDFYTNNFTYIGSRTTGSSAGKYVIVGPGWNGIAPADAAVIRAPTNAVWVLGRLHVTGTRDDLDRAHREQDGLQLSPLNAPAGPAACAGPPIDASNPWNYFTVADAALTENPPPARDAPMLARLAAIDVGPGRHFDPARFDPTTQQAMLGGIAAARQQIESTDIHGKVVNGWAYPPPGIGNFGSDYVLRAAIALKGLAALTSEEAVYLPHVGAPLSGERHYQLHFATGQLPPAKAFWSLSAYEIMPDKREFFAANPIGRYAIGDKSPGLRFNPDGSLDILIRHETPGAALESNWLPAPAGHFALILRAYLPQAELVSGAYTPPPIETLP